jgi:hypothetical protein
VPASARAGPVGSWSTCTIFRRPRWQCEHKQNYGQEGISPLSEQLLPPLQPPGYIRRLGTALRRPGRRFEQAAIPVHIT